jgi:hypothetical protein
MPELHLFLRLTIGYFLILILGLAACTAAPDSTRIPVQSETVAPIEDGVEQPPATPFPSLAPTIVVMLTPVVLATATTLPVETAAPYPTNSPLPTMTAALEETPQWSEQVVLVQQVPSANVVWSPQANQFVYDTCSQMQIEGQLGAIFVAQATTSPQVVGEFICSIFGSNQTWTPDGRQLLFTGLLEQDLGDSGQIPEVGNIFITSIPDRANRILLTHRQVSTEWDPSLLFWLDAHTFLYTR